MRHTGWTLILLTACSSPGGPGDECACTSDCEDGLYCTPEADPPLDMYSSCDGDAVGQCTEYRKEGETCDAVRDERCESGLLCQRALAVPECVVSNGAEGDACWHSTDCEDGLVCNHGYELPECRPRGAEGEPCAGIYEDECQEGLVCDEATAPFTCASTG